MPKTFLALVFISFLSSLPANAARSRWADVNGPITCISSREGLFGGIEWILSADRTKLSVKVSEDKYGRATKYKEYDAKKTVDDNKGNLSYETSSWFGATLVLSFSAAEGNSFVFDKSDPQDFVGAECSFDRALNPKF